MSLLLVYLLLNTATPLVLWDFILLKNHIVARVMAARLCMQDLSILKVAILDSVPAQLDNYRKFGFQLAYHNIRYQGLTGGKAPSNLDIIKLTEIPFKQINLYDSAFFPADRASFLKLWLTQPDSVALGIIQEDKLVAYGVIRACHVGYKIGPLFANSPEFAETLFLALNANVRAGQPVFLDIMEKNPNAFALVRRHKMQPAFETARMYTQQAPALRY